MTWYDSLPESQRELKDFQKRGINNNDLDEFRKMGYQDRWEREMFQKREEEARQ